jgi:hypothetical protein
MGKTCGCPFGWPENQLVFSQRIMHDDNRGMKFSSLTHIYKTKMRQEKYKIVKRK